MPEVNRELLSPVLRFRPWPPGDPVAPWLVDLLDKVQLVRWAAVELELNKNILEAQLRATVQALEIIKGNRKK